MLFGKKCLLKEFFTDREEFSSVQMLLHGLYARDFFPVYLLAVPEDESFT
jgi:hypothetical protein